MSDESLHHGNRKARLLRAEEKALLQALLFDKEDILMEKDEILSSFVVDMLDGGMGGIRFVGDETRKLGRLLAKADYVDEDGVRVSIIVNADENGRLFEVDFWKVNFASLKRYPSLDLLIIEH